MQLHQNFIAGKFVAEKGSDTIPVYNPARDTVISETPDLSSSQGTSEAGA